MWEIFMPHPVLELFHNYVSWINVLRMLYADLSETVIILKQDAKQKAAVTFITENYPW
jgi:hypothetical protein